MARRKSTAAVTPPQSREEAIGLVEEFGRITGILETLEAGRKQAHAKIHAEIDKEKDPKTARLDEITERLRIWWAGEGAKIAGKNRSAIIAGCRLGIRATPTKVTHKGMTVKKAVDSLISSGLVKKLLTVKHSLNKTAIQDLLADAAPKGIRQQDQEQVRGLGFALQTTDEFFIDPEPLKRPQGGAAQQEAA